MDLKNKIIIEWKTLKIGEKIYKNSLINGLKKTEKIYILTTGNIFEYLKMLYFVKKMELDAKCYCMNSFFTINEEYEIQWILKIIKKIIDDKEDKNFIYCDVKHFIMEDLYKIMPMYTDYISNCKLSGLYEFLTR